MAAQLGHSALLQIERASEQLLGHEESRLRLSVFSSFAARWLVPRLPDLQRLHPQVDLALEVSSENPVLSGLLAAYPPGTRMGSRCKDSEEFVRLPCHSLVTGDKFYFAWKTSRRRGRGIQILCRWLVSEAIEGGLPSEAG